MEPACGTSAEAGKEQPAGRPTAPSHYQGSGTALQPLGVRPTPDLKSEISLAKGALSSGSAQSQGRVRATDGSDPGARCLRRGLWERQHSLCLFERCDAGASQRHDG